MSEALSGPCQLRVNVEQWPLAKPFRISGYTFESLDLLVVELEQTGHQGRGEAAGIYYKKDTPRAIKQTIESLRATIERGITRDELQRLLPPGGARNALDCALWDLEAKVRGGSVWDLAQVGPPRELLTTFTCGADAPEVMVATARSYNHARALKLKLTGEPIDAERVQAVRDACPEVWLAVDANQGFTRDALDRLMPVLVDARVALIEQPYPIGEEHWLQGYQSPIPIAADESAQCLADLPTLVGRFNVVNIKLDKCGGLTEALAIAREAQRYGLSTMVGNMLGTSLAMAPAFVVGQLCSVVDLDGPVFLKEDREPHVAYRDGHITCPKAVWG
jgi:L-Ala-D/L-Glu epimerase